MTRSRSISVIASSVLFARAVAAAASPETAPLVERAGGRVQQFWERMSAVSCTETLMQTKLTPEGKTVAQRMSMFDYVILMQLAGDELTVDESRLQQGKPPKAGDRALLATSGFSTLMLILHPHFQPSYEYSLLPDDVIDGKRMRHVEFVHVRGRPSPSVLQLRGREYPIEWKGSAWIDAATGDIARVTAALKSPMEDVGLTKLNSDVRYARVSLKGMEAMLPQTATIEAGTSRQLWRNVHQFSRYKQFSVTTDVKTEAPKQ